MAVRGGGKVKRLGGEEDWSGRNLELCALPVSLFPRHVERVPSKT